MLITKTYDSSSSNAKYVAKYETATGHVTCSCRGFRTPNKCWHIRDIVEQNGGDAPARAMAESKPAASNVIASGHSFIKPMLAVQLDKAHIINWRDWSVEEKFDGHRAIVMVVNSEITAWSRSGKRRDLPTQVRVAFGAFPNGIYDGELMGKENGTFADVRRLGTQDEAYFQVFDVINHLGDNLTHRTYLQRRAVLVGIFAGNKNLAVRLAKSITLRSQDDVEEFVSAVWARGGEGAILKRNAATYQAGKRSPDFVKVKKGGSCTTTVLGFDKGTRGEFSVVRVRTDGGIETSVKNESKLGAPSSSWVGRTLRIEYTEIRDGAVVNPRADRWEED